MPGTIQYALLNSLNKDQYLTLTTGPGGCDPASLSSLISNLDSSHSLDSGLLAFLQFLDCVMLTYLTLPVAPSILLISLLLPLCLTPIGKSSQTPQTRSPSFTRSHHTITSAYTLISTAPVMSLPHRPAWSTEPGTHLLSSPFYPQLPVCSWTHNEISEKTYK